MDKTIPENQLMDRYLNNIENKQDPNVVQDVKMIFLNMSQVTFAEWLKENRRFYKEAIKNKKQTKGKGVYENKYLAARALANIIQNVSYFTYLNKVKDNKIDGVSLTPKQKEVLDNFYSGDKSVTDSLLSTLSSRINRIFKKDFLDKFKDNFFKADENGKQKFINYIVDTFNNSQDLSELATGEFTKYLKENKGSDISNLFLAPGKDDIKNHRMAVMLTSLFYSQAINDKNINPANLEEVIDNETVLDGSSFIDLSEEQINKLIQYKGEFKEGKVFKHASIAHNNTATLPIFVETENDLDDFLVGVDLATNNMYMDMSDLSSIGYSE